MKKFVFLIIFLIILSSIALAAETCDIDEENCSPENQIHNEDIICIAYFYGDGCPSCANVKPFLDDIEQKYGELILIEEYEIYHDLKNYQIYNDFCNVQSISIEERGVPFIAIDDEYYMGSNIIKENLESKIDAMLESGEFVCPLEGQMACHSILHESEQENGDTDHIIMNFKDSFSSISLPLVIVTGLVDGVNPCAFAVLIFLLTFLLQLSSNKKRMVKAGSVYIFAVYLTYFLAGIGLLSVIQVSGFSGYVVKGAAVIAILAGLVNIKDYFWYGKGITLAIPKSRRKTIEKWTRKANVPSAFILGFLVSMFELPCTGGVYLAILAMLADGVTRAKAVAYLLVYNFMFVLPLIVILVLVLRGMKAEHLESWRQDKKTWMKLAMGLLLVALGIIMILGWM